MRKRNVVRPGIEPYPAGQGLKALSTELCPIISLLSKYELYHNCHNIKHPSIKTGLLSLKLRNIV